MARRKMFGPELPPAMKKARAAAKRAARKPKAMVPLMRSVAQSVVNRELETKFVAIRQNGVNFNSGIAAASEFQTLIPATQQAAAGTIPADWQRVGNNITPISCKTQITISLYPRLQSVNVIAVLYCLKRKQNRNFTQLLASVAGVPKFLKTGDTNETKGFEGLLTDAKLPINDDEYQLLHKKVFQLTKNVGLPNIDATTGNAPNVAGNSSRTFTIVTKLPKTLSYLPGVAADLYPENSAPFWVLGYAHVDGTTNPDTAYTDLNVSYVTSMTFKDA